MITLEDSFHYSSDDVSRLKSLLKNTETPAYLTATLTRLLVVMSNASSEAQRDRTIIRLDKSLKKGWDTYFNKFESDLDNLLQQDGWQDQKKFLSIASVSDLKTKLIALSELRNIISHGLYSETAKNYESKIKIISDAGFSHFPHEFSKEDAGWFISFDDFCISVMGIIYCSV